MRIRNFDKVDKYLYRSAKLKPVDIMMLKDIGIKKIISLDDELGHEIADICQKLKIKHLILPIDIYDNKSIRGIVNDNLVSTIRKDGPTLVHCRAGKDRTGLVCAIYSLMTGKKIDEVKKRLFYFGFGVGLPIKTKDYYLKVINEFAKTCKSKDYLNNDSLIQFSRSYMDMDPQAGYLDPPVIETFAPYLDISRQYPYQTDYPEELNTEYSRETFEKNRNKRNPETQQTEENIEMPLVGLYYNDINNTGLMPSNISGLIYD